MREARLSEISFVDECRILLNQDHATFLKHSAQCGFSREVYRLIRKFCAANPLRVHVILVKESRAASKFLERETGVRHESPQVIAIYRGEVFAQASHQGITTDFLKQLSTVFWDHTG